MHGLLVLTNCPSLKIAEAIAEAVVEQRVAACVNILAPCRSIYQWQGKTERAEEIPLLIKTTADHYSALEAAIQALHPYDVPEIIALQIERALPAYLAWIAAETKETP